MTDNNVKNLIMNPSVARDKLEKQGTVQEIANKTKISKQRISDWLIGSVKPTAGSRAIINKIYKIAPREWDLSPSPDGTTKRGPGRPPKPKGLVVPVDNVGSADPITIAGPAAPLSQPDGYAAPTVPIFVQRMGTLESVRMQIQGLQNQLINPNQLQGSAYASLQNSLRGYLKEEKDILKGLEDTEYGWAETDSFKLLVEKIYIGLKGIPEAIKVLDEIFESEL